MQFQLIFNAFISVIELPRIPASSPKSFNAIRSINTNLFVIFNNSITCTKIQQRFLINCSFNRVINVNNCTSIRL